MGNLQFNANEVEPNNQDFSPLPAGDYKVIVSDSEICDTKTGNGQYLKVELTVIEGEYENRKLWSNLNIVNASEKAQQIGRGQLSALCHAVGKLNIADSAELHDIPMLAKVAVKNNDQYGLTNEVKAFKPLNGQQSQQPAAQASRAATSGGTSVGKRPWER